MFHQEGPEARPGAPAEGVEDEEALEARTLLLLLPDGVQYHLQLFLSCGYFGGGVSVKGVSILKVRLDIIIFIFG